MVEDADGALIANFWEYGMRSVSTTCVSGWLLVRTGSDSDWVLQSEIQNPDGRAPALLIQNPKSALLPLAAEQRHNGSPAKRSVAKWKPGVECHNYDKSLFTGDSIHVQPPFP